MLSYLFIIKVSECDLFAAIVGIELVLVKNMHPIAESMHHFPMVFVSHHRTPFAFALYVFLANRPYCVRLNNSNVGTIVLS